MLACIYMTNPHRGDRSALMALRFIVICGLVLFSFPATSSVDIGPVGATIGIAGCDLPPPARKQTDRATYFQNLIDQYGGRDFENPKEVNPTSKISPYILDVKYADYVLAGCPVHMRSYNGGPVGDTMRVKAGDAIYVRLTNNLPASQNDHPQNPPPGTHADHFSFNVTNLHTHGLHVAPQGTPDGESDNVLIEIQPGEFQDYRILIPANHPAGTFWYHAHVHGSTAIQVTSGMAGALIVENDNDAGGGLDSLPVIINALPHEKIFVLQQFNYGKSGTLESFDEAENTAWLMRGVMVNGQLVPTIRMRPGEIQRWRFIHAGVQDNILLNLDEHQLHEIADDGIALGRIVSWPSPLPIDGDRSLIVGPGYRVDVLIQANLLKKGETHHEYFLRDLPLRATKSIQAATVAQHLISAGKRLTAAEILKETLIKPESIIAKIIVEGEPLDTLLPTNKELADRVPSALRPILDGELDPQGIQRVSFAIKNRVCNADGTCPPIPPAPAEEQECDPAPGDPTCQTRYLIDDRVFMPDVPARTLKLGSATEWILKGNLMTHPFHIHLNPFQTDRLEPSSDGTLIRTRLWKDTLLLPSDESEVRIRSRYLDYKGKFVLHCHILGHEDRGMMERVDITD